MNILQVFFVCAGMSVDLPPLPNEVKQHIASFLGDVGCLYCSHLRPSESFYVYKVDQGLVTTNYNPIHHCRKCGKLGQKPI